MQLEHDALAKPSAEHGTCLIVRLITLYGGWRAFCAARCDDDSYPTNARSRRPIRTCLRKTRLFRSIAQCCAHAIPLRYLSFVHFARQVDNHPQEVLVPVVNLALCSSSLLPCCSVVQHPGAGWFSVDDATGQWNLAAEQNAAPPAFVHPLVGSARSRCQWLLACTSRRRRIAAHLACAQTNDTRVQLVVPGTAQVEDSRHLVA